MNRHDWWHNRLKDVDWHECFRDHPAQNCHFVIQTTSVRFPKGSFTIMETFTCESRNRMYVLISKICKKTYFGESIRRLPYRFRNHAMYIHNEAAKPVYSFHSRRNSKCKHKWSRCFINYYIFHQQPFIGKLNDVFTLNKPIGPLALWLTVLTL